MGNTHIDIIWLIPVTLFVGWTWLVYRLGIEVGRIFQHREEKARRRHPSNVGRQYASNVRTVRRDDNVLYINNQ